MTWTVLVLIVGVVALVAALLYARTRRRPMPTAAPTRSAWTPPPDGIAEFRRLAGGEVVARLGGTVADPDGTSAQRLARELADQAFAESEDVQQVVVEDATGQHVATIPRRPAPLGPPPTSPDRAAAEGHRPGHPRDRDPMPVVPHLDDDVEVPGRSLADRLQLPDVVRAELRRPDDVVDVVRSILVAGGHEVRAEGTTLFVGGTALLVIPEELEGTDPLSSAYLRFQRSGARSGIIIHAGRIDPAELRRRDAVVKHVHYTGREAILRMAAAADLGLDPLAAARGVTAER